MTYNSHEIPQRASNDAKRLLSKAIAEGHLVYITYRDREQKESKRTIQPLEWVGDYKIRAFCHLAQAERHFVVSGIREICLVMTPNDGVLPSLNSSPVSNTNVSKLDQWRASEPALSKKPNRVTRKRSPQFNPNQTFSQVQNSEHWQQLITYYAECLNREYLQDYLIEQGDDYEFFSGDEDVMLQFLAGGRSLHFPIVIDNKPVTIAKFITNPTKRDQQLCIGYPSLVTSEGKIAPLFFTPCEIVQQNDEIILHADEYQLNYAVLYSLDLDKEAFESVVSDLNQYDYEDLAGKLKGLQEALVLKLEALTTNTIPKREIHRPKLHSTDDQLILLTTPCLFWASKNAITSALIEELEQMSKGMWDRVPQSLSQLLNMVTPGEYPTTIPLEKDGKVFITPVNDGQRQASHAALKMPFTVVTGPPGTGKTQLVINIIANAVIEGKNVLFASRNNQAVDEVVKRLMSFDGLIRTGSLKNRKEAADTMTKALSKAAIPHATKDISLLVERYKQFKTALANNLELLNEIQRLKANQIAKRQKLDTMLADLPQALANQIEQDTITADQNLVNSARQFTASLIRTYEITQQQKNTVEAILQEHIVDNRHKHPLIIDLKNFERDWGGFGPNIRKLDHSLSLENLQHYVKIWVQLLDAVDARLDAEKASKEVDKLEKKLAELMKSLPSEVQLDAQNAAKSITKSTLSALRNKTILIDEQMTEAQKASLSNWFGFRRGGQIRVIVKSFNALLSDLDQPLIQETPKFGELHQHFTIIKNYVMAIYGIDAIENKRQDVRNAKNKLAQITSLFEEKTRDDFNRLKLQLIEPSVLRTTLVKVAKQVAELLTQRNEAVTLFRAHIEKDSSLISFWSHFQRESNKDEYVGWTLDGEISINILQRFTSQWLSVLNAIEIKAGITQLEAIIESKGGEEGAIARLATTQENAISQAIEILNSTWLQNIDNLEATRIQRVKDYASLVREVSETYNKQKYGSMMSLQETYTHDIIAAFPVWATTNLSISRNLPLRAEMFDLLIIDEASQCDIPSALPLMYRAKQVVIIGDAMQLRHIATLSEDSHQLLAAEHNIATEVYSYTQHSVFDLATRSVGQHPGILLLREHYRSAENIIRFSNQAFYDDQLIIKTDLTNRNVPVTVLEKGCGIFWLNVTGEAIHPPNGSTKNLQEVAAIQHVLPAICQQIQQIGWDGTVGIITPYREQKNLIQSWVKNIGYEEKVAVGTAHTFQGGERDILLFSTVLAPHISNGSLAWLRRSANLLNVAVTRARTTLIIIGDFNFCISLPDNHPYKQLAEYVRTNPQTVLQSWKELPLISAIN